MTDEPAWPVTSYPVIIVVTQTYRIWIDDWDEEGPDKIIEHLDDAGDTYEHLDGVNPIDGWLDVRAPDWASEFNGDDRLGPLPQCLEPDCEILCYYGRWCLKHNPDRPPVRDVVKTL